MLVPQNVLTMEDVTASVLSSSFFKLTNQRTAWKKVKEAPTAFDNVQQYVRVFKDLLVEELKAHLIQVYPQ